MIDFDKDLEPLKHLSRQRRTRVAIFQALCQNFFLFEKDLAHIQKDILKFYSSIFTKQPVDRIINEEMFSLIFNYAVSNKTEIEQQVQKYLRAGWNFSEVSENIQLILMAAVSEISASVETDAPIIINEYIEITKLFEDDKQAKFVNGILEKIRRDLRE